MAMQLRANGHLVKLKFRQQGQMQLCWSAAPYTLQAEHVLKDTIIMPLSIAFVAASQQRSLTEPCWLCRLCQYGGDCPGVPLHQPGPHGPNSSSH